MTRRSATLFLTVAVLAFAWAASVAQAAEFGLKELEVSSSGPGGSPSIQAGSHPFSFTTNLATVTEEAPPSSGNLVPVEEPKDVRIAFPPGLVGNPTAVPRCPAAEFLSGGAHDCPNATAIGIARVEYGHIRPGEPAIVAFSPVYNLFPSPGSPGKIGFVVEGIAPVVVDLKLNPNPPYNVIVPTTNITQAVAFLRATIKIWGVPAASAHDSERGECMEFSGSCPVSTPPKPFLTLPTSCESPLSFGFEADSWQNPSPLGTPYPFRETVAMHDPANPSEALSPSGCAKLEFAPHISAQPTSTWAESPTGLDVGVNVQDEGIDNPAEEATAASTIKKTVLTLPEGMTINPSQAEGLGTCSEAQLEAEGLEPQPGRGCPGSSKIGTVEVESPLLEGKLLKGSLFVATPYQNPTKTLIGLYMVFREPELGVIVKLPGKVELNPITGQIVGTFDELPQLPFSHFNLHFREGGRSPLVTPPACGTYTAKAEFTPWADPASTYTETSSFTIGSGIGGGSCPAGDAAPFHPGFTAGTLSNAAGQFSPLDMRLTRADGEQGITRFTSILPPGLVAKIAGVPTCPDSAIEAAKTRSGMAELAAPSCPAASHIGHVLGGAGVGPELTYVQGQVYLAGPYGGAPLSVVVITPAVAGPFDIGTVVVREGLNLNPETAVAEVDGAASDPIPRILDGIPLRLRDLRVYIDRPEFTLNPTSCEELAFRASIAGSGADGSSSSDDSPFSASSRFQAADCASLEFKPKLKLSLKGGTKRGAHPQLTSVLTARPGDANVGGATVLLPHTEFLDQGHVSSPCTRVQFNVNACPPGSILGTVRAFSPLLDQPLEGQIYFRSNGGERKLPDIVLDLHGQFHIVQVGFVDSRNARIRTRFASIPDAPISKVVLSLNGGKNGLLVNSADLCKQKQLARVSLFGHNGRQEIGNQQIATSCKKSQKHRHRH